MCCTLSPYFTVCFSSFLPADLCLSPLSLSKISSCRLHTVPCKSMAWKINYWKDYFFFSPITNMFLLPEMTCFTSQHTGAKGKLYTCQHKNNSYCQNNMVCHIDAAEISESKQKNPLQKSPNKPKTQQQPSPFSSLCNTSLAIWKQRKFLLLILTSF